MVYDWKHFNDHGPNLFGVLSFVRRSLLVDEGINTKRQTYCSCWRPLTSLSHIFFSCQQPDVKRNVFEMRINPLNLHTLLLPKWFSRTQKTLRQGYLKKESRHKNVKKKKDRQEEEKKNKQAYNAEQTHLFLSKFSSTHGIWSQTNYCVKKYLLGASGNTIQRAMVLMFMSAKLWKRKKKKKKKKKNKKKKSLDRDFISPFILYSFVHTKRS